MDLAFPGQAFKSLITGQLLTRGRILVVPPSDDANTGMVYAANAGAMRNQEIAWCRHWLDPNNDGNPSDGIDGFRADHVLVTNDHGPDGWGYNLGEFWTPWHNAMRATNPALVSGPQRELFRGVEDQEVGIGVVSRIDPSTGVEYLVVRNPGQDRAVAITVATPGATFSPILGTIASGPVVADAQGAASVKVSLGSSGVGVLKADRPVPPGVITAQVSAHPASFAQVAMPVAAEVTGAVASLAFAVRPAGTSEWRVVPGGSHAPYVSMVATPEAPGTELELVAVARDFRGNVVVSSTKATQGRAVSPDEVFTAIGDFQKEVGCAYDDQPDCAGTCK